jgi:hypothetical protein
MSLRLVSHINGDDDLLEAWLKHYLHLGVTTFHFIVHGPRSENIRLFELKRRFPILIEDSYEGEYSDVEKKERTNSVISKFADQWLLVVDSDEFLELPFNGIWTTTKIMELTRARALFAPMLQRVTANGSLDTPETVEHPFIMFPLCSVSLYSDMGSTASIDKYPLFYCTPGTKLWDGGNHRPPSWGGPSKVSGLRGVTHHFKFRRAVLERLRRRIQSSHPWRHESDQFQKYLEGHDFTLPLQNSFSYSRKELFRRGLLRRFPMRFAIPGSAL